jgi:hypothetical protein
MKKLPLILICAVLASTAPASTIVFTDNTFDLGNYSETVFKSSGSDTVSWTQCPTCGNPGQALRIQVTLPAATPDLVAVGFINSTFAYNPLTQGAIATIDASVDKQFISNIDPSFTLGNTFRPSIEQDGIFYLAAIPGPGIHGSSNGYDTISQTGLLATAFTQYDFVTGTFGSAHPNFAGDPLLLGLTQITQFNNPTNVMFEADYDNLKLAVNGVPDSGSTILLLLGSVTTLLVLQRMLPRTAGVWLGQG